MGRIKVSSRIANAVAVASSSAWHMAVRQTRTSSGDDDQTLWWDNYTLFIMLSSANDSVFADTGLNNFMLSYQQTKVGLLYGIKSDMEPLALNLDLMDSDQLANYESKLQWIAGRLGAVSTGNSMNTMEANIENYAMLLLEASDTAYFSTNMATIDSAIWGIATQCVYEGGPAVYEARAYLASDSIALLTYPWNDSCITTESRMRPPTPENKPDTSTVNILKPELDYKLIPNLYDDNLTGYITLGNDDQGVLQIYSIDGRLMSNHLITAGTNAVNLSTDGLQAGVYLYKVYVNGQLKTTDKLVVVR